MIKYLKVRDDLAERVAHEPSSGDVPDDGWREAEEDDEKVGDGQVDDEHVGHGAHRVIAIDGQADQKVAHQSDKENEAMQTDHDPFVEIGEDVLLDAGYVIVFRLAIVISALTTGRSVTDGQHSGVHS